MRASHSDPAPRTMWFYFDCCVFQVESGDEGLTLSSSSYNRGFILIVVYFRLSLETRASHSVPVLITVVLF